MEEGGMEGRGGGAAKAVLDEAGRVTTDQLPALFAKLNRLTVRAPFWPNVQPDAFDSRRAIVHLYQGGLGLPDRDYYLRDDAKSQTLQQAYRAHVATVLGLIGDDASRSDAIYALEREFAQAAMPRVDQRDPYKVNNPHTRAALAERTPGFDWTAWFAALGAPDVADLNVRQPAFVERAAQLTTERPIDLWRTYLRWHIARALSPYLPEAFERAHFEFYSKTLQGQPEQKPRWKRVLEMLDAYLPDPLRQLFVERAFPPQAKQRILDLVADLRTVLAERIDGLEWMGPETRVAARKKLDAFAGKMGYPDTSRDYRALKLDRGPFVDNVLRAIEVNTPFDIAKLTRPVDRAEWRMSAPTVNAYYYPPGNEIVFPAGILHPPFFYPHP